MRRPLELLFCGLLLAASALPALATVPSTMSYQGVLTDNAGNLVADGPYNLVFRLYDVSSGGTALWTETQNAVPVAKGGFAVILGGVTPLGLALDRQFYLGVSVNGGAELSPRVILTASPQALSLRLPFAATEASGAPPLSITNTTGTTAIEGVPGVVAGNTSTAGTIGVMGPNSAYLSGFISDTGNGAELRLLAPYSSPLAGIYPGGAGGSYGSLYVTGPSGIWGGALYADMGSGWPGLLLQASPRSAILDMGQPGDASVYLPNDAIGSSEILDEPGIAQNRVQLQTYIPNGPTVVDLASVTISIPAGGYIVVDASGEHFRTGNGTQQNRAWFMIKDTPGGGFDVNNYLISGSNPCPTGDHSSPVALRRTYFKPAGTHTFYFQAVGNNPGGLLNACWNRTISAIYFPTSYGSVTTIVSASEQTKEGLTGTPAVGFGTGGHEVDGAAVTVDLRELELRAARLQAEADRARLEAYRARLGPQAAAGARAVESPRNGRKP